MKKTISLGLVILLLVSLSSCVIKTDKAIELCGYVTDITSIDIYFTDEEYSKPIDTIREDSTPLYTIKKEDEGAFIDRILSLEYEKDVVFLPITYAHVYSNGYIIVINYSSGNFDLIAESGLLSCVIESDGSESYSYDNSSYCGECSWSSFIEEYIK